MIPYFTSDLSGTGGQIRERIEDFVVEEIPLYEPQGAGNHCYVKVQKSDLSTREAIRRLARALGVPPGRVGYAGLKDARAICRQTFSLQGVSVARALAVEVPGLTVIEAKLHRNKLKVGHLRGNKFWIRIRGVGPGAGERAGEILARLAESGVPNLFGSQRFGSKGDSFEVGRALIARDHERAVDYLLGDPGECEGNTRLVEARRLYMAGDLEGAWRSFPPSFSAERRVLESLGKGQDAERALSRIPKGVLKLLISSYQSRLFNQLLTDRMPDLSRLERGDLAFLHDRGAVFLVEDPAVEQPRADAFEISPSAPLFGRKVALAEGKPGEREREILEDERLSLDSFSIPGARFHGERRPLRAPLSEVQVREEGEGVILLRFGLPKGSYATAVVREVTKTGDPGLD